LRLKFMPNNNDVEVDHNDLANAIRALSMDAIQKANSGHPGMPMGMADVATVLFTKFMKFDPAWPAWPNRDRFVLSAGHGSMLLYSLLHLTGYPKPSLGDLKNFRQLHSPCAGHPEFGEMDGIETTTGPLGQGLTMSVGMALAERLTNARLGNDLMDHFTYVIAGDGCLQEGISHEALSMAGHLKLGKLVVFWDDNEITIDGSTDLSTSDDQQKRFDAAGWHVQLIDGHDPAQVEAAIVAAQGDDRPSMIACKTTIGYGSPNKGGTSGCHGAPLGDDEIVLTREKLGWPHDAFIIPADVKSSWEAAGTRSTPDVAAWKAAFDAMSGDDQAEFNRRMAGDLPEDFDTQINNYKKDLAANPVKKATRQASQMALEVINGCVPETIGGSADLTGSNNTNTSQTLPIQADDFTGRYVYYGVREFGMAAVMNGMTLHGGYIPYGGTFFVFTDYARGAIRLSALMKQRVIYVMTHDSIGLGEDGPTHQPVEHLASFRAMPNINVIRPCDVVETAEAWAVAMKSKDTPSILALTRQGLAQQRTTHTDENLVAKGGYVLAEASGDAKVTLIATGSEVEIAMETKTMLEAQQIGTRVVSMPATNLFDQQSDDYKQSVLGKGSLRVSIEAGSTFGWERYIGLGGLAIGIDSFGASAPIGDLYRHFGLTADQIVDKILNKLD
jgi:transketolase